jgi:serine O-acetyltransferase
VLPRSHRRPLRLEERLVKMMHQRTTGWVAYKALKLLGVDIAPAAEIGDGFRLPNGANGVVIGYATKIGNHVTMFPGVTVGFADAAMEGQPGTLHVVGGIVIDDDAVIGPGAKVLFKLGQTLTIGEGSIIGPNAVVLTSVPPGEVWEGIPARRVRDRSA